MQNRFLTVDDQGVASVMTALKAHHGRGTVGQEINNLALAFVTPLGADHYHIFTHGTSTLSVKTHRRGPGILSPPRHYSIARLIEPISNPLSFSAFLAAG